MIAAAGILRFLAVLTLLFLPGAWLAFGIRLSTYSLPARIASAIALSPAVVGLQFYAIRLLGASFEQSIWILVLLNLPSIWFIVKHAPWPGSAARGTAGLVAVYLLLAVWISYPAYTDQVIRTYEDHTWMHSSIIYQFPLGALHPEEPELAGVPLGYPWLWHVYISILGWGANLAPTNIGALTALLYAACVCVLVWETALALGAMPEAGLVALVWLTLGTNATGVLLWRLTGHLLGDLRYTPWLRKFTALQVMPSALALYAALVLVCLAIWRKRGRSDAFMASAIVAALGLLYPVYFLPAMGLCGILWILLLQEWIAGKDAKVRQLIVVFSAALLLATVISVLNVKWVAGGRTSSAVAIARPRNALTAAGQGTLALLPFLAAVSCITYRRLRETGAWMLLAGSLPAFLFHAGLIVGDGHNEYKFLFCVALGLAPVCALALEKLSKPPRRGFLLVAASAVVLMCVMSMRPDYDKPNLAAMTPAVRDDSFWMELPGGNADRGWIQAIVAGTPLDTIVAAPTPSGIFYPVLLRRALLAPPDHSRTLPGYWMSLHYNLVGERAYPESLLQDRRRLLRRIFECKEEEEIKNIVSRLRSLSRPVAIVFNPGVGAPLQDWLAQNSAGRQIFHDAPGTTVWLLQP